MAELKVGARMKSAVCATEVMIISTSGADVDLSCGGSAMVAMTEQAPEGGSIAADYAKGTLLGKRYVNAAGDLELPCTKPGDGSLAVGGEAMVLKAAKALPSSD